MRSLVLLALALLLALAPISQVAAQLPAPPTPIYTLEITGAPAEFGPLAAGGSASAAFQVVMLLENVVCTSPVTIPITITATAAGAPAFFSVAPEPSIINISLAQGPFTPASPGGGIGDSAAVARITGNITTNASVQVTLVATAPAPPGPPQGCQGAGAIGAATSAPVVIFANMTAPPAEPAPTPEPEKKGLPGFEAVALLAAVGVLVALRRR